MKKKLIAVMMGLVVSLAPTAVYAQENAAEAASDTTEEEAAVTDENTAADSADQDENAMPEDMADMADASQMIMGTVTEIGEDSITISVSTGMGGMDAGENQASEDSEAETEETMETDAAIQDAESETQTISLTDETQYLKLGGSTGGMGAGDGEAPEMPDGENGDASSDGEEAPEIPDGEDAEAPADAGEAPEIPDGENSEAPSDSNDAAGEGGMGDGGIGGMAGAAETEEITLADIEVGDMVIITLNDDGSAATVTVQSMSAMGGGMDGEAPSDMGTMGGGDMGGGQSSGVDSYDAANTVTEDTTIDSEEITSSGTDENAILVSSDVNVTLTNDTIIRDSDDSTGGDNSSFYGVGAAVLATDGTLTISDSTISTDAEGGAGVFAYGDGVIYVMDTVIDTQLNTSGGIHVAGGGTLYAWDVTATTNGTSSAAVRSDRGSGTMVIDGGTYTSNGSDSPAVYCTAEISVSDATLTATGAEAVCIEGLNTLRLYDCDLTGMAPDDERNDVTWTVIVYQSMSGDSEVGNGTFQMTGGTLTSTNGGLFYTTNTECTITLENVEITAAEDCEFFLQCTGNTNSRGWGSTGSNGSDCLFTAISQEMSGDVIWDSISTLDFYMTDGSTLTGAVVDDETWAGQGGSGSCNVIISGDSAWIVTGDSTLTSLSCSGTITDADGNTVTIQGTDGTVYVEGTSEYTVTVDSYSDSADTSGASVTDTFADYETERPEV
ncbi:MAG: hypothetical protein LIO76_04610 [Clostridiales bacterium]|nr:hypothetical protein [Clostridiales bacterium]